MIEMKTMAALEMFLKGKDIKEGTIRNYRHVFDNLNKFSEEFPTTPIEIAEWLAQLNEYEDSTKRLFYKLLKSVCAYFEDMMDVPNPMKKVKPPKVEAKDRRSFSKEELVAVMKACSNDLELALICTLLDSSARISEVGDMNILRFKENGFFEVKGKVKRKQLYRLDVRLMEKLKSMANSDGWVWNRDGVRMSSAALRMLVNRICLRAGLKGEKLYPHTFRHSAGSLIAMETGSALAVKGVLGHSDVKMSMNYIHDVEKQLAEQISPLAILAKNDNGDERQQLQLKSGDEEFDVTIKADEENSFFDDMLDERMRNVGDEVSVRPLLKSDDLGLIRNALMCYIRNESGVSDGKAVALWNRMVRKVN